MSVGYGERGVGLPREARVLELGVGELVALGLTERLASARACRQEPLIELDVLVEHAERILAITRRRCADDDAATA